MPQKSRGLGLAPRIARKIATCLLTKSKTVAQQLNWTVIPTGFQDTPMSNHPNKRKRNWAAISLRSVFVIVTIAGAWLGWNINKLKANARTIAELRNTCFVGFAHRYPVGGPHIDFDAEIPGPVWLRNVFGNDAFSTVTRLLPNVPLSEHDLEHVGNLSQLEMLSFFHTKDRSARHYISAKGWRHLSRLRNLRSLDLRHTNVEDEDLVHFKNLTLLESLDVSGTAVTEAGVERLKEFLPNLHVMVKAQ